MTMKRRRFLKYLSGIPFVGSLTAQGNTKRQPETLEIGQVWKGRCFCNACRSSSVEYYNVIIECDKRFENWWIVSQQKVPNIYHKRIVNGFSLSLSEEEIRKLTYLGHITELDK